MSTERDVYAEFKAPEWSCLWQESKAPFTVGAIRQLICKGPALADRPQSLKVQFLVPDPAAWAYTIQILKPIRLDQDQVELEVTGYKPGEYSSVPLGFVDAAGNPVFKVAANDWTIQSVIKQGEQFEKPFGPFGPISLATPVWYWAGWFLAAVLMAWGLYRIIRKTLDRRALRESLRTFGTALAPYNQFNKDFRKLVRALEYRSLYEEKFVNEQEFIKRADEMFRLYLVRELYIPAVEWSLRDIMSELRTQHKPIYQSCGPLVYRTLNEFIKAAHARSVTMMDCEQMIGMVRKATSEIHTIKGVAK